ncbi:MAG TPA: PAS domain S-box protein [Verrucomicrobiae bacterium]|nr:PAS domain S-box protein [Verrucomicrobiae bacterium]
MIFKSIIQRAIALLNPPKQALAKETVTRERLSRDTQLSRLATTVPGVIYSFRLKPDGSVSMPYVASAVEELSGLRPDQLATDASPLFGAIHAEDADRVNESIRISARDLTPWRAEFRIHHRTKGVVWLEGRSVPERELDGSTLWYGFVHDITERKQAETELKYHKALLEETGRIAKVGGWEFDPATGAGHWTDEVARIHELDPGVKPNMGFGIRFYHGESRSTIQTAVKEAIELGKPYDLELEICTAKGHLRWVRTIGHPIVENGKVVKVTGSMQDITERKRTEESLLDLQRQQRVLLDNIPDIVWVKDKQNRYVAVNEALCKAYGHTTDEVVGCTDFDMVPHELAERYQADDRRVMESRKRTRIEEPFEDSTGHRIWIETIKTPIVNNQGVVIGTAGIARDITERKTAESQLRIQSAALQSAANGIVITDRNGAIIWVNPAFTQLTGYEAHEVIGQTPRLLKSGKHDAEFYRDLWETIRKGNVWRGEIVNHRKDGREYTEEMTITPIRGADGAIEHFIAVKQDITDRKQASRRLLESEERFREFAENVGLVFWIANPDSSQILYVNPTVEAIWGIPVAEIYRDPEAWLNAIHADDRPRVAEAFGAWITGKVMDYDVEYRIIRPDGQVRWIRDSGFRICNPSGQVCRIAGIAEDITEDKRAEQELAELEVQLRLSQKLESIGRLAAGVAHEINTPNQYIGDNTRFLQDSFADLQRILSAYAELRQAAATAGLPPALLARIDAVIQAADINYLEAEIPKAIQQTLEGVDRVAKIVRAMKEFSHPGSDEKVSIDLNHAIETTVTIARNEWKYVADLVTDFDDSLPRVPCLANELNQVILNIVVNAAHAIADLVGNGGTAKGVITISTRRIDDWAEIRIRDTGPGIPEAIRGKIFDPFFTTKPLGQGTGQGLAIARSVVVDKHHGELTFETEPGKGTTFIVRLPLAPETSDTEPAVLCQQTV